MFMSETGEQPIPFQQEKEFWNIVNERMKNGLNEKGEYDDGLVVLRSFLDQESNAGIPGKEVGGAAVAMNDVLKIMQDQLGIVVASSSVNPDSLSTPKISQETAAQRIKLPFAAEFMSKPDFEQKTGDKNADLTERLIQREFDPNKPDREVDSYIDYAALLMNGTDVVFPNYWTAGKLAIEAKKRLQELHDAGKPLIVFDQNGEQIEHKVLKIPKIVYCNHSLPARIDEELSKDDNPEKQMDERRKNFQEEIYREADAIMVWTEAEKHMSVLKYPDIPDIGEKMSVVKAPVEFDKEKAAVLRPEMRRQFFNGEINDETLVFYYQGRFEDYKHPEILLKSFIELYLEEVVKDPDTKPNIACLLVGGPFMGKDGKPNPTYQAMQDMINQIPEKYREEIKARISMPGSQPKEAGHSAGDILVFPSIKESLGLTLVEAVMSGNLVIARKTVPTVTEANGHSGVYAVTQEEFKDKMRDLLHDPEKRKILHEKLQDNASEYTPENTAKDIKKMLHTVDVEVDLKDQE